MNAPATNKDIATDILRFAKSLIHLLPVNRVERIKLNYTDVA